MHEVWHGWIKSEHWGRKEQENVQLWLRRDILALLNVSEVLGGDGRGS